MNVRLTNRHRHFEILRSLPIGRCDVRHSSGDAAAGAMWNMKEDVRATPDNCGKQFFSSQARRSKEDARRFALAEKYLTFCVNGFL
jgi:hypothetical protein